ncbi:MAG: hypothetical protein JWL76_1446 [Thermoleophilia bacterium]|nr:hypothetical protein [Thermoleophilia bacterium]
MAPSEPSSDPATKARTAANQTINVTVTFPLSGKGAFHDDATPDSSVEDIRNAAMAYFGVSDDASNVYVLSHKRTALTGSESISDIADRAQAIKLTLAKQLVAGGR